LNRLLTASPFSLEQLNQARLDLLARFPGTCIKPKGVLRVDNTLLTHYRQDFEQIATLRVFDHVTQTYVWAHDLVTPHYSDDDTDYPALFQLWKPVDLAKLEQGLRAAQVPLKPSKELLRVLPPSGVATCWAYGNVGRSAIPRFANCMTAKSNRRSARLGGLFWVLARDSLDQSHSQPVLSTG